MIDPPLTAGEDEDLRRLAGEILQRREFAGPRRTFDLWELVPDWLGWLFGWGDLASSNPVLYYAILAALLSTAAILITHIAWSIRAALRAPGLPQSATPAPPRPTFADEAERLASEGRYLEAAHRLQLGVLELLLRGRRLELARFEPNRVLRRRLAEARLAADERRELGVLLDRFERRWFRDRQEDPDLYRGWRSLYQRVAGAG